MKQKFRKVAGRRWRRRRKRRRITTIDYELWALLG